MLKSTLIQRGDYMDNSVIVKTLNDHDALLGKHGDKLDVHDEELTRIKVKDGIMETKLNTTNKLLAFICGTIFSGFVAFVFSLFK